jgi:DNA polymerase-1
MFFLSAEKPVTYHIIDNPRKLSWMADQVLNSSCFSFDVETNHPTIRSKRKPDNFVEVLSGISFAWGRESAFEHDGSWKPGKAAYVKLYKADDTSFWRSRHGAVVEVLREILESDIPKVAQYGKFDMYKLCELLGITVRKFMFDTHLAHAILDEERLVSSHALKSDFNKDGSIAKLGMSDVYLDPDASSPKDDLERALDHYDPEFRRYSKAPIDILGLYGCGDSDYCLSLMHVFKPMLEQEGQMWVFDNIIMPLQTELVVAEIGGMPLDLEVANQVKNDQYEIMQACYDEVERIVGTRVDIASNKKLGAFLFEELKLKGGRRNKNGWVTDAEALDKLDHPVAVPISKFRRAQQIYGNYAVSALDGVEEITNNNKIGWVHVSYFPDSLTGRLRCTDPNLNTLPRPENGGDIVKHMWVCGDDYRFIFKDYSQIELRFAAHYSGEPVWIDGFNAGYDLHAAMAQKIWHPDKTVDEVKKNHKADRSKAKSVNFGIIYGESEFSLAKSLGITFEEADKLVNVDYFGTAPVLKGWIDGMHEFVKMNGYVCNLFGRRRHLPNAMIDVPRYLPWPDKEDTPQCYRRGPKFNQMGLDERWRGYYGDWYEFVNNLEPEEDVRKCIPVQQYEWMAKCLNCPHYFTCIINGEIKKVSGIVGRALRQSVNAPIQGGASDLVSFAWALIGQEFRKQGLDAYIALSIHDELLVHAHVNHVEAAEKIMEYYMSQYLYEYLQFSVPLVTDTEIVRRWSEKK